MRQLCSREKSKYWLHLMSRETNLNYEQKCIEWNKPTDPSRTRDITCQISGSNIANDWSCICTCKQVACCHGYEQYIKRRLSFVYGAKTLPNKLPHVITNTDSLLPGPLETHYSKIVIGTQNIISRNHAWKYRQQNNHHFARIPMCWNEKRVERERDRELCGLDCHTVLVGWCLKAAK